MILSASTLGAPGVPLSEVLGVLSDTGIHGVELRTTPGEIVEPGTSPDRLRHIRNAFDTAGIRITALASYVRVAQPGPDGPVLAELEAALEAAHILGAAAVRVFPGAVTGPASMTEIPQLVEPRDVVDRRAAQRLSLLAATAGRLGVLPVLETHDSHPRGEDIARITSRVDGPVGVVWDLMHPWRVGETLDQTWDALLPWLAAGQGSVQVKDARFPEDPTPCLIGEGTLPCEEFGDFLTRQGYAGVVTLELEAAWYPAAPAFAPALASARQWYARHWTQKATR